jgi:hypothetical protein
VRVDDVDEFGLGGRPAPAPVEAPTTGEVEPADPAAALLGALPTAAQSPAFQKFLADRLARSRPVLQKVPLNKKRRFQLNFGPLAVGPGQSAAAAVRAQVLFRGEKLINAGDSAGLQIEGLFVGQKSQFPSFQNSVSVSAFDPNSLSSGLLMDTCAPGLDITFKIRNIAAATLTWAMVLVGSAVL